MWALDWAAVPDSPEVTRRGRYGRASVSGLGSRRPNVVGRNAGDRPPWAARAGDRGARSNHASPPQPDAWHDHRPVSCIEQAVASDPGVVADREAT
jgi:hypothetical protein